MEIRVSSVSETEEIAYALAKKLEKGAVIAMFGGLGAGKTAFVRGLARGLKVSGEISSPTFALVHEYHGKIPLIHFDMYRISNMDDLYTTGYFDYLDGEHILAIEWSEHIEFALPEDAIRVTIEPLSENERNIKIDGGALL